jgi:hypothetical protein
MAPHNRKAGHHIDTDRNQLHRFLGLISHLVTLTRNAITFDDHTFDKINFSTFS